MQCPSTQQLVLVAVQRLLSRRTVCSRIGMNDDQSVLARLFNRDSQRSAFRTSRRDPLRNLLKPEIETADGTCLRFCSALTEKWNIRWN